MAQPHKGPRTQVNVEVPDVIMSLVERDRVAFGVSSTSQYLADLVCHLLGSPQLARELDRRGEQLQLSIMPVRAGLDDASGQGGEPEVKKEPVKMRVPNPVVRLIDRIVSGEAGASRKSYLEDLICTAYGRVDLARALVRREEQLTLSIVALTQPRELRRTKNGAGRAMQMSA